MKIQPWHGFFIVAFLEFIGGGFRFFDVENLSNSVWFIVATLFLGAILSSVIWFFTRRSLDPSAEEFGGAIVVLIIMCIGAAVIDNYVKGRPLDRRMFADFLPIKQSKAVPERMATLEQEIIMPTNEQSSAVTERNGAATGWVKVNGDLAIKGYVVYVDPATIRKTGNRVTMWSLVNNVDPSVPHQMKDKLPYLSYMEKREYDCQEEQTRGLFWSYHSEHMGRGEVVDSILYDQMWWPIEPGNVGESMLKIACR